MRVLIAEDEKKLASLIRRAFQEAGFAVDVFHDGTDALDSIREISYDVVVLDIMLPGLDGLAVLRRVRADANTVPILLLSARGETYEKVEGLELGADDYLAKPFAIEELLARVRALYRRTSGDQLSIYRVADLSMDVARHQVTRGGRRIELTPREFSLLELLLRSPGHVFTRTQICEKVWDYQFDPGTNLVDVYVQRLRRKLDGEFPHKLIHTIRGVGYSLSETGV